MTKLIRRSFFLALGLLPLGCGGPDSPFRVGALEPIDVRSDLEALRARNDNIQAPTQPAVLASERMGAEALYTPRPGLAPAAGVEPSPIPSRAPDTPPVELSLFDTIVLGLRQSRDIQSAYLNRVVQKFSLYVVEEDFVPRFDSIDGSVSSTGGSGETSGAANIGTGLNYQSPYGTLLRLSLDTAQTFTNQPGVDESATSGLNLSVTQPLLRGAGRDVGTAQLRLARLGEQQNVLSLKSSVINAITTLISAYLSYVGQERNVAIARRDLERSRDLLESNRLQVNAGRMAPNEVIQTELSVSNSELSLQEALNSLDGARLTLLNLLSLDPRTQLAPTLQLEPERLLVDVERAREIAYANNPGFLTQQLSVEQQRVALLLARDNLRWRLDASAGYGQTGEDRTLPGSLDEVLTSEGIWDFGLSLSIPLDLLDLEAALTSAEVGLEQAKLSQVDARENLDTSVRDAVRSVEAAWQRYLTSRRSVELAQRTLDLERTKLNVGRSTNFEVLARQATLQQAEVTELNNVISYLLALATLDQQLGTTLDTWQVSLNDDGSAPDTAMTVRVPSAVGAPAEPGP